MSQAEIESIFQAEWRRLVSVLTGIFGPHNLELAEDVVQDAFVAALREWTEKGVPDNPPAWLMRAARNRAIDTIRRERTRRTFSSDLSAYLDSEWTLSQTVNDAFTEDGIRDDQLKMIFMCCHEELSIDSRVTLILKSLCRLRVPAIARALLTTESTINKRLYRIRKVLRGVHFALPHPARLNQTLDTVHAVLYLMFNEGFHGTHDQPIRADLCRESISLTRLLVEQPSYSNAHTSALLALMCFNAARLPSRLDSEGRLVPLDQQDRSLWLEPLIDAGFRHLAESDPSRPNRYQLEAAIAARHASAESFEATDWESICRLYNRLIEIDPAPLVQLNRAVAISYRDGPQVAIALVKELHDAGELPHSNAVAAVLANLHARNGSDQTAQRFLDEALNGAPTIHERDMILRQMERLRGR